MLENLNENVNIIKRNKMYKKEWNGTSWAKKLNIWNKNKFSGLDEEQIWHWNRKNLGTQQMKAQKEKRDKEK